MEKHTIPPVYTADSRVLILGSFPSVKSRETAFFYGHPQNRFWKVTSKIYGEQKPQTVAEKKNFLIKNKIAVWDVIHSCDIVGSSDSSIKNIVANDISDILSQAKIEKIFTNGKTAYNLYNKYIKPRVGIEAVYLPSTSPANAAWNEERLVDAWKVIKEKN